MKSFNFLDQVAFITGTNKKNGIGRAIANALLNAGAKKIYATARDVSQLDDFVKEHDGKVVAVPLDVTDLEAIKKLPTLYKDVTMVVNNAGYFSPTQNEVEGALKEIQVNYIAPMAIVNSFAPILKEHTTNTAVVNVASIAALVNFPIGGLYSASKAAAHSLTQAQRRELSTSLVIGVYPGPIDTAMAEGLPFDKTPPNAVGDAVIKALKEGQEDVFPDAMAQNLHEGWKQDAKALEQQMAKPVEVAH